MGRNANTEAEARVAGIRMAAAEYRRCPQTCHRRGERVSWRAQLGEEKDSVEREGCRSSAKSIYIIVGGIRTLVARRR